MLEIFQQHFKTRRLVRSMTRTWEIHFGTFSAVSLIIDFISLLRSSQCVGNHAECKTIRKTRRLWTFASKRERDEEQIGKLLRRWKTAPKLLLLVFLRISRFCWQFITFLLILNVCQVIGWKLHSSLCQYRIGITGFLLDSSSLKARPISCPETSARNYHY